MTTETRRNENGRPAPPDAQEASANPWQRLKLPALRHPRDPAILSIALPAVLALAADPLLSVVDTLFVGRLGAEELAALGVNTALFSLAFLLFGWLATATTPIIATALARGDKEQVMAWLAACTPHVMVLSCRLVLHVLSLSGTLEALAEARKHVGRAPASVELLPMLCRRDAPLSRRSAWLQCWAQAWLLRCTLGQTVPWSSWGQAPAPGSCISCHSSTCSGGPGLLLQSW